MKISNSKKELARIISENGGWGEGNHAIQDKDDKCVWFMTKMKGRPSGKAFWPGCKSDRIKLDKLLPNWHQTVLSRAEYFHLYPATDADGWIEWKGGECPVGGDVMVVCKVRTGKEFRNGKKIKASILRWRHTGGMADIIAYRPHKPEQVETVEYNGSGVSYTGPVQFEFVVDEKPTLDKLLQDWRNADDYAKRKQAEADEAAAMRDERWESVQVRAGEIGVTVVRRYSAEAESNLVITDYRQLCVGDVLRCKALPAGAKCNVGDEGVIMKAENCPLAGGVYVNVGGRDWFGVFGEHWEFIRRPQQQGDSMSNWISMKNELPVNGKFILMKWHGKVQQVIYYRDSYDDSDYYQDSMGDYDGMPESEAFIGDMHWMYLPE